MPKGSKPYIPQRRKIEAAVRSTVRRPKARPVDLTPKAERGDSMFVERAVKKKANGGVCRGMGAAIKGGKYGRMG